MPSAIRYLLRQLFSRQSRPFFIVGCGHSGTSLLLEQLSRHPKIFGVPGESKLFVPRGSRTPGNPLKSAWGVFRTLIKWEMKASRIEASAWVEKTPGHLRYHRRIKRFVPRARFIGIFREPRDVVASLMGRGQSFEGAIERWQRDNALLLEMAARRDCIIVSFESLLEDNERTLRKLVEFMGLEMDPSMKMDLLKSKPSLPDRKSHADRRRAQLTAGLYDSRGEWEQRISSEQAQVVESLLGGMYSGLQEHENI